MNQAGSLGTALPSHPPDESASLAIRMGNRDQAVQPRHLPQPEHGLDRSKPRASAGGTEGRQEQRIYGFGTCIFSSRMGPEVASSSGWTRALGSGFGISWLPSSHPGEEGSGR